MLCARRTKPLSDSKLVRVNIRQYAGKHGHEQDHEDDRTAHEDETPLLHQPPHARPGTISGHNLFHGLTTPILST